MRQGLFAAVMMVAPLMGCGQAEPHAYPASAKAQFNQGCAPDNPVCVCEWDQITRAMAYEDYQAAMETFRTDGLMDPRLTRARTHCIEHRHPASG